MGRRKHFTGYFDTVAAKIPLTKKEAFYAFVDRIDKMSWFHPVTPSQVIHALIDMILDADDSQIILLLRHIEQLEKERKKIGKQVK
jgi:Mg2+ and Co2+ transporter CorA